MQKPYQVSDPNIATYAHRGRMLLPSVSFGSKSERDAVRGGRGRIERVLEGLSVEEGSWGARWPEVEGESG